MRSDMIKKPDSYEEATAYIAGLPKFTRKHSLEHTREFMRRLGDPAADRKVIHVAGTNGKGSVCAYAQAILEAEGKKTGFFTSPHLVTVNERIQINRAPVNNEEFCQVFIEVLDVAMQMSEDGLEHPSYFEFLYGMAMKVFSYTDVEYIVLETGLGGRLDATSAFLQPALTIITSISLDHTEILGDSIQEIAAEKAGIIREGVPLFFDGSNEEAAKVIRRIAQNRHAPCREISKNAYEIQEVSRKSIAFSRANAYDKDVIWRIPICGLYQVMNAVIAIEAMEYLLEGEDKHKELWQKAIASVRWQGRMEEAAEFLVIDGAHNPGAVEGFVESVKALGDQESVPPIIVFSAMSDKKYEKMISYLCQHLKGKAYIVTEIADERKVPACELAHIFRRYTKEKVIVREDVRAALQTAYEEREDGGYIYCLGSLYLAGMLKQLLQGGDKDVEL